MLNLEGKAEPTQNWAELPPFPGYQGSVDGEIRNKHGRILRQRRAANGAMMVDIGKATAMVHRLILPAFTGHPLVRGYRPKQLNGDLSDNQLENLVWAGKPR